MCSVGLKLSADASHAAQRVGCIRTRLLASRFGGSCSGTCTVAPRIRLTHQIYSKLRPTVASPRRQHVFHFEPPRLLLAASLFALPPNTQQKRWWMHTMDVETHLGGDVSASRVGFLNQVPSARDRDPRLVSKARTVRAPAHGRGSCSASNERDACMVKGHCRPIHRRRRLRLNTDADGPNFRAL